MKRFLVFILALFYLAVASGITVNVHYCMGKLASVDYGHSHKHKCGKCGMPDNGGCCHTESTFLKLQDDHQLASADFSFKQPEAPAIITLVYEVRHLNAPTSTLSSAIHAPPDDGFPDVYLYNCVFRI